VAGQVLTMQVDLSNGTLKFWVDGKPHGPGFTHGVISPVHWAVTVYESGETVQIVPTPDLEPWRELVPPPPDRSDDDDTDYCSKGCRCKKK
jgi:hypothetical protein